MRYSRLTKAKSLAFSSCYARSVVSASANGVINYQLICQQLGRRSIVRLASYVETGGGARNNLRLSAIDDTSYSAGLGFRLKRSFKTGVGLVTPRLNAEWGRKFGKANIQYVDYSDITVAAARSINFRETNQDYYKTSLGAMIDLKNEWSFDLEYGLMYNSAMLSSGIKVQVSKAF